MHRRAGPRRPDANGRFATSGHSQGGSGTLNAAPLNSKVVVTCPVQLDGIFTAQSNPADLRGTPTGPALIMCGGADTLAPCTSPNNGDTKFDQATVPVTRISVVGAPHVGAGSPVGAGGLYAALVATCVDRGSPRRRPRSFRSAPAEWRHEQRR